MILNEGSGPDIDSNRMRPTKLEDEKNSTWLPLTSAKFNILSQNKLFPAKESPNTNTKANSSVEYFWSSSYPPLVKLLINVD